jgi:L-2-hydroxyglutarate oxidase LhgO
MSELVDCVVIGAGVVGLATASALARRGRDVLVLEAEAAIGTGTSSRNSEVIHAGIYYPTGSLKARLCVAGRERLYAYCATHNVEHRRTGKLIVATSEAERPQLEHYRRQATLNGAGDLEWVDRDHVRRLEPEVECVAALWSPRTGIVDSHGFMLALQGDLEARGGAIVVRCPVLGGHADTDAIVLESGGEAPMTLRARTVVNCAGLLATEVSRSIDGVRAASVPECRYAKGHYYTLAGRAPFRHLVYPVAVSGGLGIHVTLDLGGQARFGPDVEWLETIDYSFDDSRRSEFASAIRRYYPALDADRLQPGYTGIRPKLVTPGEPAADFVVAGREQHGVPGYVALYGIESPGLTAALALGEYVADRLD